MMETMAFGGIHAVHL